MKTNKKVRITVSGGVVVNVEGVPKEYTWEIIDLD